METCSGNNGDIKMAGLVVFTGPAMVVYGMMLVVGIMNFIASLNMWGLV